MFEFGRFWQYYAGILLLFPFATFISGCDLRNDSGKTKLNVVAETQIGSTKVEDFISDDFNTGDIVFQESTSSQAKYIKKATGSRYTHCGIIVQINGEPYVLEAVSTVTLTPFEEWKNRGVAKHVLTVKCNNPDFKIDGDKYLGKKYDSEFKWDDRKMYCSELVYKIYQDNGIDLGELHPVKHYNIKGMESYLKKRGISPDQLVIAPSDLINQSESVK